MCWFCMRNVTLNLSIFLRNRTAILSEVQTKGSTKLPSNKSILVLGKINYFLIYLIILKI